LIKLYTIGFAGKAADNFFSLLMNSGVTKIIDTRVNNTSQLAGFSKGGDLKFFAKEIANISYEHNIDFAPTKELLSRYRGKQLTWEEYEFEYLNLLDMRNIGERTDINRLHKSCLLCSEHFPDKCHRRLLAEYLNKTAGDIDIIHLLD
jgi:uncharacterized protein (DUF488 family)